MRKITLILFYTLIYFSSFAQESSETITIEEAQEESRSMIKELFEFRIFKDAIEIRQTYDVQKNSSHNEELKERIIQSRNTTNINFYVKGEMDYDHFWVWVCNNPSDKTPDGATLEMLNAKYKIVFNPQWDKTIAPPKDNRLYTINVSSELPESISNNFSTTIFNEAVNKLFVEKTISLVSSPKELINTGLFAGFELLESKIDGGTIDPSKFSIIMWGDNSIDNNSVLYAWSKVPKEILLLAYNNENELYKVDWTYGESTFNNTKFIELVINESFYNNNNEAIEVKIEKSGNIRNYKFQNLNINEVEIIEATLKSLTSLREDFEKLRTEINSYFTDNTDPIILEKESKYLKEGMSKLFEEPPVDLKSDLDKTLAKMYGLDALMQAEIDYNSLNEEIKKILEADNKAEFISQVLKDLIFLDATKEEEEIIEDYTNQIETITLKKLKERLNKEG